MKIQNLTPQTQNTQFKSNAYVKQLTKPITNTKVAKNLTMLDVNSFQAYMIARRFSINTNEKEVKDLFKFQGEEFLAKAFDFLIEKLNINKKFIPLLGKSSPEDPVQFSYLSKNNIILTPYEIENYPNIQIFQLLRHELQHYQQNMLMLRDDEIGKNLPTIYANKIIDEMQCKAIAILENSSYEELAKNNNLAPEEAEFYKACDYFIKRDDVDGFIAIFEPLRETYKNEWTKIRENLLAEYGQLTPIEKERAQAYFNDFSNIEYYNKDGSVNLAKHISTGIEFEANIASDYTIHQIFGNNCFFKIIKDATLQFISAEDKTTKKLLDDTLEEVKRKQNDE